MRVHISVITCVWLWLLMLPLIGFSYTRYGRSTSSPEEWSEAASLS